MYFKRVEIGYLELVNPTEWNCMNLERLTTDDKKTVGMLIFLTRFRHYQKSNWVENGLLGDLDTMLVGEVEFGKYLVELAEEYFLTLFAKDTEPTTL